MGLLDLFKPKWKHSNVEVRSEAVRELPDTDTAALTQVATRDPDPRVRRIAIKKLRDAALLGSVARDDQDEVVRRAAADQLRDVLMSTALLGRDEAQAIAALQQLSAPRQLAEVARQAKREPVRRAAVERLADQSALLDVAQSADDAATRALATHKLTAAKALVEIALHDADRDVALAALGRVHDRDALELIARNATSKAARAAARDRLLPPAGAPPAVDDSAARERRRLRQAELCATVEAVSSSNDWESASASIKAARAAWAELGTAEGDDQLRERFYGACERFTRRHDAHLQAQIEASAIAARQLKEKRALEAAARKAEPTAESLAALEKLAALCAEAEALAGPPHLAQQQFRAMELVWRELSAEVDPGAELRERFERVTRDWRRRAPRSANGTRQNSRRRSPTPRRSAPVSSASRSRTSFAPWRKRSRRRAHRSSCSDRCRATGAGRSGRACRARARFSPSASSSCARQRTGSAGPTSISSSSCARRWKRCVRWMTRPRRRAR
ncbi:MAG: hypothetical protein U1E76_00650 [Planctomycetota bacterium]